MSNKQGHFGMLGDAYQMHHLPKGEEPYRHLPANLDQAVPVITAAVASALVRELTKAIPKLLNPSNTEGRSAHQLEQANLLTAMVQEQLPGQFHLKLSQAIKRAQAKLAREAQSGAVADEAAGSWDPTKAPVKLAYEGTPRQAHSDAKRSDQPEDLVYPGTAKPLDMLEPEEPKVSQEPVVTPSAEPEVPWPYSPQRCELQAAARNTVIPAVTEKVPDVTAPEEVHANLKDINEHDEAVYNTAFWHRNGVVQTPFQAWVEMVGHVSTYTLATLTGLPLERAGILRGGDKIHINDVEASAIKEAFFGKEVEIASAPPFFTGVEAAIVAHNRFVKENP